MNGKMEYAHLNRAKRCPNENENTFFELKQEKKKTLFLIRKQTNYLLFSISFRFVSLRWAAAADAERVRARVCGRQLDKWKQYAYIKKFDHLITLDVESIRWKWLHRVAIRELKVSKAEIRVTENRYRSNAALQLNIGQRCRNVCASRPNNSGEKKMICDY